jgi:hypothetical protein
MSSNITESPNTTPTPSNNVSSDAPLLAILGKTTSNMSVEELQAFVLQLRQLSVKPQVLKASLEMSGESPVSRRATQKPAFNADEYTKMI